MDRLALADLDPFLFGNPHNLYVVHFTFGFITGCSETCKHCLQRITQGNGWIASLAILVHSTHVLLGPEMTFYDVYSCY